MRLQSEEVGITARARPLAGVSLAKWAIQLKTHEQDLSVSAEEFGNVSK